MANQDLPKTMKAHVLAEFATPYQLQELPLPSIDDPNDILIKVDAASYCHTDAVLASGKMHPPPLPHIGCHEFAGTVVQVSKDPHGLKVGDRVAVPGRGNHVCGECFECRNPSGPMPDDPGYSVYCPNTGGGLGVGNKAGGFREYAIVDCRQVAIIPDGMSAVEAAPLMCAGLTIYAALRKCELRPGQRVGVMGCGGGLGHLGLQFATKMGLKTMGVDVNSQALELARSLQTSATIIDSSAETPEDVKGDMKREDGGENPAEIGLDAVIILPDSQKSWDYGMKLLKNGGLLVLVSFPPEGFHISADDLVFRRIRVTGSLIGSNKAMKEMFDFVVKHDIKAKIRTYPFSKLNQLVDDYHAGAGGKLVLDMHLNE
ncbi:hypothetical protein H2200_005674 [Cladophialophora chaetospira]|uniref:Enoyl reductase (ER) domain-containing protein n=1 Tax=Cladophialophora chaetospira TaxID=386627 RepID=A0AA38X9I0_9EURO|nr:hypothetical protein H2200_005674 [Cladophialophora chaetospira]